MRPTERKEVTPQFVELVNGLVDTELARLGERYGYSEFRHPDSPEPTNGVLPYHNALHTLEVCGAYWRTVQALYSQQRIALWDAYIGLLAMAWHDDVVGLGPGANERASAKNLAWVMGRSPATFDRVDEALGAEMILATEVNRNDPLLRPLHVHRHKPMACMAADSDFAHLGTHAGPFRAVTIALEELQKAGRWDGDVRHPPDREPLAQNLDFSVNLMMHRPYVLYASEQLFPLRRANARFLEGLAHQLRSGTVDLVGLLDRTSNRMKLQRPRLTGYHQTQPPRFLPEMLAA